MSPHPGPQNHYPDGAPRASGDEPAVLYRDHEMEKCSPRERG